MTAEIWKVIPGHRHYEVSSRGRVRSLDRKITQDLKAGFSRYTRQWRGKMLAPRTDKDGYQMISLGRGNRYSVHVLVLIAFVGPRPKKHVACHFNGDPLDNRISNLRWGTVVENRQDATRHGTDLTHNAKLTEKQVLFIRKTKKAPAELKAMLSISEVQIARIRKGECWKHLLAGS